MPQAISGLRCLRTIMREQRSSPFEGDIWRKKKKVAAMPPQTLINYFSSARSPRSAPVHGSNERGEGSVVSQNSRRPRPCVCSCIKASQCAFQCCVTQGILCLSFRLPANEKKLLSQQRWGVGWGTKGEKKTTRYKGRK